MTDLTDFLNAELERRRISMRELGRLAGFSATQVSDVINGNVPASANFVIAMANALGEDPVSLLHMAGHLSDPPPPTDLDSTVGDIFRSLPDTQRHAVAILLSGLAGKEAEHAPTAPSLPVQAAPNEPLSPLEERMQQHVLAICDVVLPLADEATYEYLMDRLSALRDQRRSEREQLDQERHPDPQPRQDRST